MKVHNISIYNSLIKSPNIAMIYILFVVSYFSLIFFKLHAKYIVYHFKTNTHSTVNIINDNIPFLLI